MTVKELIARLQAFNPEMEVTTAGPEFGLVRLELLDEVHAVAIEPSAENSAQYRPAKRIDRAEQVSVLCCGPSDPSYVGQAS